MNLVVNEVKKIIGDTFFKKIFFALLIINSFVVGNQVYQEKFQDIIDNSQNYSNYLRYINQNYDAMKALSLFSDKQSFAYKNTEKLKKDYQNSNNVVITEGSSVAIQNVLDTNLTDIMVIFIVLFVSIKMIFIEKDTGMQLVIMPTVNGRKKLICTKINAIFFIVVGTIIAFYGSNYITAGLCGDFGLLNRSIQSVFGYEKCCYALSVAHVMLIVFVSKIAIYLLIAIITTSLAVYFDKVAFVYAIWILVFTISFIEKMFIRSYSNFYILNQVNILSFLNTETYFSEYSNLNICGTPVSSYVAFLTLIPVLILVAYFATVRIFSTQEKELKEKTVLFQIKPIRIKRISKSLFKQELYKILVYNKGWYIIILMAFCIAIFLPEKSDYITSDVEVYYRLYLQRVEGKATQEKLDYLYDIEEELEAYGLGQIEKYELSMTENTNMDSLMYQMDAVAELISHGEYLLEKQGDFLVDDGYVLATGGCSLNEKLGVLILLLMAVILLTANVECVEYDSGMDILIAACPNGGKKLRNCKLSAIFIVLFFTKLLADGIYYGNIFCAYGVKGLEAPACSMEHLNCVPPCISIGLFIVILMLLEYIVIIVYAYVIFVLQKRWKNYGNAILGALLVGLIGLSFILYL